ncbi:MAG: response regulator transcription factor [Flavobacteriaceae bacterium]|jgi:DNA-binding NarL/FixJ family response regulator|nr:response regulator transcription factor [Flavobacteriaceae bacterium]
MNENNNKNIKFLLADDHLIVRQGIQFIIEECFENPEFFYASSILKTVELLQKQTIDILILDAQFPDGISLSVIPEIRKIQPEIKILIFTSFEEENFSLKFIKAGANGYLSKLGEENEIKLAIENIAEKGEYYPPFTQKLLELSKHNPLLENPLNLLSEREIQIANLYAKGYGNLEISNELSLKQNTVSTFKKRIFEKLNIASLVDLIELMKIHYNP